jgi:hypothetical protein
MVDIYSCESACAKSNLVAVLVAVKNSNIFLGIPYYRQKQEQSVDVSCLLPRRNSTTDKLVDREV